ncbi:MAG: hypothetical protein C0409_13650 [Novosphingobium sp.]|nr:hypothetical protein [Novosphingobium sp.]
MADLDDILGTLGAKASPPALATIDDGVMRGLAARREAGTARRGMVMAVAVAAVVGIVGSIAPAAPARAEPLFGVPSGAPSHLLAD